MQDLADEGLIPFPPVCQCIGMGVVRGVEPDSNVAYIVSDLEPSQIEKVNCIVRGDLTLPEPLLAQREKSVSDLLQRL